MQSCTEGDEGLKGMTVIVLQHVVGQHSNVAWQIHSL